MEVSEDEFKDTYSDIEPDEEATHLLDRDLDDFGALRPLDSFEFGSENYCKNYRRSLGIETKARTNLDPFDWQLDVAVNTHLGQDVFLLVGTGSGKTLMLVMPAFLSSNLTLFPVSPLNALANAQVKEFDRWKLKAVAVNATTKYKDLKKDILAGKFQIIISSIEAFTDTTRLLPIVKSPEFAALGPQCFIIDEVHCIPKWGQHFRPQYTIVGTLRLLLTREVPMVAATATANNLMRQAIKQSLQFGSNAFEVNLGNRRSNIAYSVHRLPNVSVVVVASLEYFLSKSELL
ncbi:hypothetical protein FRC11_009783 [Ceratobasidium sp. 423]|nr:hypothetical protein FRC11_009783 [Ceratobasidium sp. 423]